MTTHRRAALPFVASIGPRAATAAALATLSLAMAGCNDSTPAPACVNDAELADDSPGCVQALGFASRSSDQLVPSDEAIVRYHERFQRAIAAEPLLARASVQRYRYVGSLSLYTTNAKVIAAWRQGAASTGEPEFDALMMAIGADPVVPHMNQSPPDGTHTLVLSPTVMFNEDVLHQQLQPLQGWLNEPVQRSESDAFWTWRDGGTGAPESGSGDADATAEIEVTFGWGDCPSGCIHFHRFKAIIPPAGDDDPTVYDLGGDPLPGDWPSPQLTTLPPPAE